MGGVTYTHVTSQSFSNTELSITPWTYFPSTVLEVKHWDGRGHWKNGEELIKINTAYWGKTTQSLRRKPRVRSKHERHIFLTAQTLGQGWQTETQRPFQPAVSFYFDS